MNSPDRASAGASPSPLQMSSSNNTTPTRGNLFSSQRSNPIAIARPATKNPSSSSDDDNDSATEDHATAASKRGAAQSLPSRLLRAPLLGSLPTRDSDLLLNKLNHQPTMLPPPMLLSEQQAPAPPHGGRSHHDGPAPQAPRYEISYGSLRESHLRGRFLDGPASYRDRATGGIRQLQHRVHFQDQTSSSVPAQPSSPQFLSIGERMRKPKSEASRTSCSQDSSKAKKQGSLGDMLEASPLLNQHDMLIDERPQSPPQLELQQQSFYDVSNDFDSHNSNMLSTSLTALEVLQSGLMPGPSVQPRRAVIEDEEDESDEQLPRNASGHNALLSRALSDPIPHCQSRQDGGFAAATAQSSFVLDSVGVLAAARTSGGVVLPRARVSSLRDGPNGVPPDFPGRPQAARQRQDLPAAWQNQGPARPLEDQQTTSALTFNAFYLQPRASPDRDVIHGNPDSEGAFDMDLE